MQKKTFLQLFLMVIIILISIIFFKTYFEKESVNNVSEKVEEKKDIKKKESNFIHNIKYVSQDKFGNNYTISSELGELNENEPELILMKNVMANINLKNSDPVKISSKNAVYNTVNYTTNFYDDVLIEYSENVITSDNLDLVFEKNIATIYNNIIYKNLNTKLQADTIVIDLITKNSKIYMNDQSKKVKIININ